MSKKINLYNKNYIINRKKINCKNEIKKIQIHQKDYNT